MAELEQKEITGDDTFKGRKLESLTETERMEYAMKIKEEAKELVKDKKFQLAAGR